MTLEQLISQLLNYEKVIGGDMPVHSLVLVKPGKGQIEGKPCLETLSLGLGYSRGTDMPNCVLIGEKQIFSWLSDDSSRDQ